MRIGQNPAKYLNEVAKPQRITVAVLNYIPFQSGFYAEMKDVLTACLDHIHANTDLPYDLMVFDNGSCEEIQQYLLQLHRQGIIQYLLLSDKNLGKGGAWNMVLAAAPGEIIAYADNDVQFYPGWLSRSVQILETFPKVGMVTARPFRTKEEFYTSTLKWAQETPDVKLESGKFLPWEVFLEFNLSLGATEEEIKQSYEETRDVRLTYHGVSAFAGSSHWQFVGYKSVLAQFLPFEMDKPMGQVRKLDQMMNDAGYLRLMVSDPLAMNMSNTLPVELRKSVGQVTLARPTGVRQRFLESAPVKRLLLGLYDRIFRWYYGK
ncbi:MAG: glycosyltransferase family 2 protein [Anaerolineaceae bacterium]|jgi:glycosyltransferase involved in cell wall biosynthesis